MTSSYWETVRREMRRGVFAHLSAVPRAGYQWAQGHPVPNPDDWHGDYLIGPSPISVAYDAKPVSAFRRRGRESLLLHRAFANLSPDRSAILAFANTYGALGVSKLVKVESGLDWQGPIPPLHSVENGEPLFHGESFDLWRNEIANMGRLLEIWDAVKHRDVVSLNKRVTWSQHGVRVEDRCIADDRLATAPLLAEWKRGELIEPAREHVKQQITERLRGNVHPRFVTDPKTGDLGLWLFPASLLTALYVLFALEVTEGAVENTCVYCGRPFVQQRKGQKYCSPSHRQLAYMKRKKQGGQA